MVVSVLPVCQRLHTNVERRGLKPLQEKVETH